MTEVRQNTTPRLLHLGCGLTAPREWVNVDGSLNAKLAKTPRLRKLVGAIGLVPREQTSIPWPTNIEIADFRRRLPFPDASFDAAYSSHVLEHLHRNEVLKLLAEVRRVLKPGGLIRMLVPDLNAIVQEYLGKLSMAEDPYPDDAARRLCARLLMRPETMRQRGFLYSMYASRTDFNSHKWMYDAASLVRLLTEAGFVDCTPRGFRESQIPFIEGVESKDRFIGGVVVEGHLAAEPQIGMTKDE